MKTAHDFVEEARKQVEEISVDQADEAIKQADLLLDVRDADEYQVSHIPGATNVSRGRSSCSTQRCSCLGFPGRGPC